MEPLHVLIHYHLRTGGVSRVIETTARQLIAEGVPVLILCGDAPVSDLPIEMVPSLDFTEAPEPIRASDLTRTVQKRFGDSPVIWHFHNVLLGKNPALTAAMLELAQAGERLILQHHDFAEDSRPACLRALAHLTQRYPVSPRITHAFINTRDRNSLIAAGLPDKFAHLLPNPVTQHPVERQPSDTPLVFSPVRAIRRKNIGETVLLAAQAPKGSRFAISLAPEEDHWLAIHEAWKDFVNEHGLPVEFNVSDRIAPAAGASNSFKSWLSHATHLLTTSIREGFGLTFIEAAALDIPLLGRRLPELDPDLAELDLKHLYHRLSVQRNGQSVDFGRLDESEQQQAILDSLESPGLILAETENGTLPLADYLQQMLCELDTPSCDLSRFSPETCSNRLHAIREKLINASENKVSYLDQDEVTRRFSDHEHPMCS